MKTIYKYTLVLGSTNLKMPIGAKILTAQKQDGQLRLWALIDTETEQPMETRHFMVYGTGDVLPKNPGTYLSTLQDGSYVWHVFEWGVFQIV